MLTLKVKIQDPDALASIRRSVIIDYLIDHNWRLVANMKITNKHPKGESSLHISRTNPASPSIAVPADEKLPDYGRSVATIITTLSEIEQRSQLEIFDDMRAIAASPAGTYPQPWDGWVCFHCGTRFREPDAAREHFGPNPYDSVAACLKGDQQIPGLITGDNLIAFDIRDEPDADDDGSGPDFHLIIYSLGASPAPSGSPGGR